MASPSYAQETKGFLAIPAGSLVVLPSGDSLKVDRPSRLVSDSAIVSIDLALRTTRRDLETSRSNEADRLAQLGLSQARADTLAFSLAGERAWRAAAVELMPRHGWLETLENFGLAAGGFAVCRAIEP